MVELSTLDYYYVCYLSILSALAGWYGLLRGKGPSSPAFLGFVRLALFIFYWYPIYRIHPLVSFFCLAYMPSFLDQSELSGSRVSEWLRHSKLAEWFYYGFRCSIVKTCELKGNQYIFAMHPHGLLPVAAVTNVCTGVSEYENLFPNLKKRVIAAATMVSLSPIFRDLVVSLGVVDCSRYSFENFLRQGYTVGVFVGGAIEAAYSSPQNPDTLDLLRKRGFIRLAMIHNIPVVPVFTFNEINHFYQFDEFKASKFWLLRSVRYVFNRVSGLLVPLMIPFVLLGTSSVTVFGEPINFKSKALPGAEPSEEELDNAMKIYVSALTKLYEEHAPKYNSVESRKLKII